MKNKFKEVLLGSLGFVGIIIWFVIYYALKYVPLCFLNISLLMCILIAVVVPIPFIGDIVSLIIWIWSFCDVILQPIDGWSIFYFVAFAIYALTTVLPFVVQFVLNIKAIIINKFYR